MKDKAFLKDTRQVTLKEMPEPIITQPNQLKLRILELGIYGTDREQVEAGYGDVPRSMHYLMIGHEMFGELVETGADVKGFSVGDYAVLTVRKGLRTMHLLQKQPQRHALYRPVHPKGHQRQAWL